MIPWKRFWCRFGESIHLGEDGQGFLTDPEETFTRFYNPHLTTLDCLLKEACLILCGDPGIGKSTELRQAKDLLRRSLGENGRMISIDFRDIPTESIFSKQTFESCEWQQWRNSTGALGLVIDGVDEGIVKIPDFVRYLTAQLRPEPTKRLQIVLVCRSAEWPVSQGQELISLWGHYEKPPIFGLCPLRQCDAEQAAELCGLSKHDFIEAVYRQKVVGLAALPATLFFLLDEFHEGGGFSRTHRELYESGCLRLSRELDPQRVETLRARRKTTRVSTPQEIYETAMRLAALFLLCGKSAIHIGSLDETDPTIDLHISDAADTALSEDVILDTIGSGLFTSRSPNRLTFAHQTFAECLAAQFLNRLPLIQIRKLLCGRDSGDEHVIPQLAETAAWVAGMNDDFFDYLCRIEPEALLRSDASKVQNQRKDALVSAVLEKAKRAELFDARYGIFFFDAVKHPRLAAQLRPYILNRALNPVVRRMALSIADECRISELTDDLLRLIGDSAEEQDIRNQAARALEDIIPATRLSDLTPLALGQVGPDPADEIRGCAISRLVPAFWSVSQTLANLQSPLNQHFYGSFWRALKFHLPQHIKEDDLPDVLQWAIRETHCFDSGSWFDNIAEAAFVLALKSLNKEQIRHLAVRVWVLKQKGNHPLPYAKDSPVVKLFDQDETLRREFVAAIINDPESPSDNVPIISGYQLPIFTQRDLEWALNQISHSPIDRRVAWASAICGVCQPESACCCWDLLLNRIEEVPELNALFSDLRAWDLDEPMARNAKARGLRQQRMMKKYARPERSLELEPLIKAALNAIVSGEPNRWLHLCALLSSKRGQSTVAPLTDYDLTEFPGWKDTDEVRRMEIRAAARMFLLSHSEDDAQVGDRMYNMHAGHIAAWLLREELRTDSALKAAVAANWVEALIGPFNNGSDHYQETTALANEINPDVTLRRFIHSVTNNDKQYGRIHCLHGFRKAWDAQFTSAALDLVLSGNLKCGSIETILTFVGPIAPKAAAACAESLLTPNAVTDSALHDRTVSVLTSCFLGMPAATWTFAWPIMENDKPLAEKVLLRVADEYDQARQQLLPPLTEKQLAGLYWELQSLFPPETDPPHSSGASFVTARKAVSWFRGDVISALEARGTEETCRELLRLADALPKEQIWLRRRYYNARTSKRRMAWIPPSSKTVLLLAKRGEARLVSDADDLMEVVMESLARLQIKLTHTTQPRAEDLWNWDGADKRRHAFRNRDEQYLSNYVARWLRDDLSKRGIVVNREVEPRQGQRTDIYVEAMAQAATETSFQTITVVIEVKGCWNTEILTAVDSQLVGDYLRRNGHTHGIYLVGWFVCDKWSKGKNKLNSGTLDAARLEVKKLVFAYDGKTNPENVNGIVLDCRYPDSSTSS